MNPIRIHDLLAIAACAASTFTLADAARSQTAPSLLAPAAGSATFAASNPLLAPFGTNVNAVAFFKLPNNMPGEWTVGLTMWTQAGNTDLFLATWSPNPGGTPTLTLTNEAAACNSNFDDFLLQIEPTQGLLAVMDRFNVFTYLGVFLSSRTAVGTPFGAPVQIQGVQGTNGWGDPSLGYVDGQLMLFYGGSGTHPTLGVLPAILMAPIDMTNPAAPTAGVPVPVAFSATGLVPHSPTPIVGPDGDVEGLLLAEGNFNNNDSDTYYADDLDPLTPNVLVFDTTNWLNGGGLAGGYIATGDAGANYLQLLEARAAWLIGDADPMVTGGVQIDLASGSPHVGNGLPNVTFFVATFGLASSPITVPGVLGEVGVAGPQISLGMAVPAVTADEITTWSVSVPYSAGLAGVVFDIQALALQPTTGVLMLTNTAKISL